MGFHDPNAPGHNLSGDEIKAQKSRAHANGAPETAKHADKFKKIQAECMVAAGLKPEPGANNDGVSPKPVKIALRSTGKLVSMPWDLAVQRIYGGHAIGPVYE
jgi:hypothetical protein